MMTSQKHPQARTWGLIATLIFLEVILLVLLTLGYPDFVFAGVGQNTTVITKLTVGTVAPEIVNISLDWGNSTVDLIPNSTRNVTAYIVARDWNNESNIANITMNFFDNTNSSYNYSDDNNSHYTNPNCTINLSYGDEYHISAMCVFPIWYYAYNSTWNGTGVITDKDNLIGGLGEDLITINALLALGLPDEIDYGIVNATYVSSQRDANVTNFGNVAFNLSLSGYAVTQGDNLSMNCTLGALKNISIGYEKYNLTNSNISTLNYTEFLQQYGNLTSSPVIRNYNLKSRENDTTNEAFNSTYWRIYVPVGVAGSCTGNIVFGAVRSSGT